METLSIISIGLLAFSLSQVSIPLGRRVSRLIGAMDLPRVDKVHTRPMPRLGGLGIFLAFWGAIFVSRLILGESVLGDGSGTIGLLFGSILILGVGIVDDIFGLGAQIKLVVQIAAASIIVGYGFRILPDGSFDFFGRFGDILIVLASMIWIIWVTNVFNLADGLDGLASGIAVIASLGVVVMAINVGAVWVGCIGAIIMGVSAGFLLHNFPPARIFLGDSGSLFLGFVFASVIMALVGYRDGHAIPSLGILMLGVPMIDGASAVLRRLRNGRSILAGDKDHLHYKLLLRNGSRRKVAYAIYAMTAGFCSLALLIYFKFNGQGPIIAFFGTLVAGVLIMKRFHLLDLYISRHQLLTRTKIDDETKPSSQ